MNNIVFSDPRNQAIYKNQLQQKYKNSRANLLLVVLFTTINVIFLLAKSNYYFLFSASIPYFFVDLGMLMCGKYPAEYYTGDLANIEFLSPTFLVVMVVLAFVIIAVYLVCWLLSAKNRYGWIIGTLVFFCLDTLLMFVFYGFSIRIIIDLLFHVWVIVSLARAIKTGRELASLPEGFGVVTQSNNVPTEAGEQFAENGATTLTNPNPNKIPDSPILRPEDTEIKYRVLASKEINGHKVVYRRVKRVNELIIDGNVYAEVTMLMESGHTLTAFVDGQCFEAGLKGAMSFIAVNGVVIEKRIRWY